MGLGVSLEKPEEGQLPCEMGGALLPLPPPAEEWAWLRRKVWSRKSREVI